MLPDGVHRLELPTPFAIGPVGCYVLRGDPLTLVDPGPLRDTTRVALEDGLRGLGLRVEDTELVVVTHQHHDHAGLAAEVARRSGAHVAATPKLATYLGDYERAVERDDEYAVAMMARHGIDADTRQTLDDISRSFRRYTEGVTVDTLLREGEPIVAGGRTFTPYDRPGHSPTDTVLLAADGVLVGGDHLLERVSSNPIAHVPIDDRDPVEVAVQDRRRALVEYLASMRATADLDVAVVLPGHGAPFTGHRDLIAKREDMHARRARRIMRSVNGARTATDLIGLLWRNLPVTQSYLALSEVLGHIDLLERDGRVRAVERDDGVVIWTRPAKQLPTAARAAA